MDHPHDQRTTSAPPRPSAWRVFWATARLLLRRFLYALVLVLRPLRPFAGFIVVILALLGLSGWLGFQLWWVSTSGGTDVRAALLPPSQALRDYIRGQQTYNADLMWSALSPQAQAARLEQGLSKATLQALLNGQRNSGLRYSCFAYIGGVPLDGRSMHFYAVDLELDGRTGTFPYTFELDRRGRVLRVTTPFDEDE